MNGPRVTHLRYVAEAAPNFDSAVEFYESAWGLSRVDGDKDLAFFAAEGSPENYVFRLRRSDERRVDVVGFGAQDAKAVDSLAADLAAQGVRFASEPGTLQTPGRGYGFRFFDPEGRVVEVSSGVEERPFREIEPRESIPVKISHLVLGSDQFDQSVAFYRDLLGLKISDWIEDSFVFMRCNADHHSLALMKARSGRPMLNHVAFELRGIDEQMRATGRVLKAGGVLRNGPGRHVIGDNTFSYFFDPNGNVSELTTEMEQVPLQGAREPLTVTYAEAADVWQLAPPLPQDAVPEAALTAETGFWTAPPV